MWLMYIMDDKPAVIGGQHAPRRRFNGLSQIELLSWSRRKALRVCKRSSGPVECPTAGKDAGRYEVPMMVVVVVVVVVVVLVTNVVVVQHQPHMQITTHHQGK